MNHIIRKCLEGKRIAIYRAMEAHLHGKKSARLNFSDIAREVGCSRKTVTYHYRVLRDKGFIGVTKDGKLFLIRGDRNH